MFLPILGLLGCYMPAAAPAPLQTPSVRSCILWVANWAVRPRWWATEIPHSESRRLRAVRRLASKWSLGELASGAVRWFLIAVSSFYLSLTLGCTRQMDPSSQPQRDINVVLARHDKELLAIPGVAGVYVGALSDGKTPCLKVML